jgi:hypothetical protein
MMDNLGLYFMENPTDMRISVRLVKWFDSNLYHSPKLLISREMVQDLSAQTSIDADIILTKEILEMYNDSDYIIMNLEDIKIASSKISGLTDYIRDMKINSILS